MAHSFQLKSEENSEIYILKRLYHAIIKIEPPNPLRKVIQCSRGQGYNHSKNFFHQKPRCVKCDWMHSSERCPKSPEKPQVCANCKGAHTTNYKGSPVHRTLHLFLTHNLDFDHYSHPQQLHRGTDIILDTFEENKVCFGLFNDPEKAFVKVWHDGL